MLVEVTCLTCGKHILKKPSQIKRTKHHFCSLKCKGTWMTINLKGENNPAFKQKQIKIICETCEKTFTKTQSRFKKSEHHYCSKKCYSEAMNTKIDVACEQCGKVVSRKPSLIDKYKHVFCSPKCSAIAHRKRLNLNCDTCGKIIIKKPNDLKYTQHFCSNKCASEAQNKKQRVSCHECGKIILVKQYKINNTKHLFCSRECMGKWQSVNRRGAKSPTWMGGLSYLPYCSRFNENKKEEIRKQYGRKCLICGKNEIENGRKLDVHHVTYDKMDGCNGNGLKLVPLCMSCHAKTNHNRDYYENHIIEKLNNMN